jgi:hypothetical protein
VPESVLIPAEIGGIPVYLHEHTSEVQRRTDPDNSRWKIPRSEWQEVLRRVEQGETYRQIANHYGVSYEAVRRVVLLVEKSREVFCSGSQAIVILLPFEYHKVDDHPSPDEWLQRGRIDPRTITADSAGMLAMAYYCTSYGGADSLRPVVGCSWAGNEVTEASDTRWKRGSSYHLANNWLS